MGCLGRDDLLSVTLDMNDFILLNETALTVDEQIPLPYKPANHPHAIIRSSSTDFLPQPQRLAKLSR